MKVREETKALQVRFPVAIYQDLKKRAGKSKRSLNAEVIVSVERFIAAMEAVEANGRKNAISGDSPGKAGA